MANTKRRTATKRTASGTTGKGATFRVPRSAKELAAAIQHRLKTSPDYWTQVQAAMAASRMALPVSQRALDRATAATH